MSKRSIGARLFADYTGISAERQRRGDCKRRTFDRFVEAEQTLAALPLHMDETAGLGVTQIRQRARRLARQAGGLNLVVIDRLQKVRQGGKPENRRLEIGDIRA